MARKLTRILLALSLVFSLCMVSAGAQTAGLANFQKVNTYTQGQYADVAATNTFAENVKAGYEYGIMQGYGTTFGVGNSITRLASIIIACRLNCIYLTGSNTIEQTYTGTTQEMYLQYAMEHGIYCNFPDYSVSATRAEFAAVLSSALPDEALSVINRVDDNAIPDVTASSTFASDIYRLYRAGIINGSDAMGTFYPNTNITRGAACAIATRMCDTTLRKSVTLIHEAAPEVPTENPAAAAELTAEEVYAACSPAVFYVETFDSFGYTIAGGSGFFIDPSGIAVTNYHVLDGCSSAAITLSNKQETYDVLGVYAYDCEEDWALIQVDGTNFPCLTIGDNATVLGGATVFAIGSPLGLQNTISQGIVSNPARIDGGMTYIQTSAAISSGSSGGALINTQGNVIGITTSSFVNGQNLNLAVPLTYVDLSTVGQPLLMLPDINEQDTAAAIETLKQYLMQRGSPYTYPDGSLDYNLYYYADDYTFCACYDPTFDAVSFDVYDPNPDYTFTTFLILLLDSPIHGLACFEVEYKSSDLEITGIADVPPELIQYLNPDNGDFHFRTFDAPSSIPAEPFEVLCCLMLQELIDTADLLLAHHGIPLTMSDFGYM